MTTRPRAEFYGIELTPDLVRELRESQARGVHLLRRNIESPDQVRELSQALRREFGEDFDVAVRHEGGSETPFVRGVTFFPGLEALEAAASAELALGVGRAMGVELRALGITSNLVRGLSPIAADLKAGIRSAGVGTGEDEPGSDPPAGGDEGDAEFLSSAVASAAIRIERDPQRLLPLPSGTRVGLLVPRLGDVADRVPIEDGLRATAALLRPHVGAGVAVMEVGIRPDERSLALAADWMAAQEAGVFLCFDAQRFDGQRRLLEVLSRRCVRLVGVTIGNFADRDRFPPRATVVRPCGFQRVQLLAALDAIFPSDAGGGKRK